MLNCMYELAEQSANGTYDGTDRTQLQKEVSQLRTEIDRIADSATSTVSSCWTAPCPLIPLCLQPLLLVLSPFCSAHILISALRSCRMRMHLAMAGVDHEPFKVRLVHQNFQQFFPDALIPPSAEPLIHTAPFPIARRQVSPQRSCAQNPKHTVDKLPIILCYATPLAPLTWQMWLQ